MVHFLGVLVLSGGVPPQALDYGADQGALDWLLGADHELPRGEINYYLPLPLRNCHYQPATASIATAVPRGICCLIFAATVAVLH